MITTALAIGVLIALTVGVFSLVLMVLRWKTPQRRGHVIRLVISIASLPCLIGVQQAILWLVFLPAMGREQMAMINAARAEHFTETTLVRVGDTAPEFALTTTDGDTVSLPSPGNVVLINFFATWCGPCQAELPHIDRIWSDLKDDDHFQLVVIGREETPESVRTFRDGHGFTFPMAADPDRDIYSQFAKELIPRTVVVSPAGQIVYSKAGFYEEDLEELKAVLKDQLSSVKQGGATNRGRTNR